jgi:RNA polymerase sigma-70 factor (ECF subfamily)
MLIRGKQETHSHHTRADQQAAQRGDIRAFSRLVNAHRDQIYALSYRILGDEQAAVSATQAAVRLAASHAATLPAADFRLWLWRWVVSACQARCRPVGGTSDTAVTQALPDRLARLPLELRLALVLVDVVGLDYAQTATVLDARYEQVSGWLAEGRARLMAG